MNENTEKKSILRFIASIFWNPNEHRLRALWRLLGVVLFGFILMVATGLVFSLSGASPPAYLGQLQGNICLVAAIWLALRFLDRRKFSETGIQFNWKWWIDFGFGLALGIVLMSAVFFVELAIGWISVRETFRTAITDQSFIISILPVAVFYISVGIAEELAFRGYLLLNVAEGFKFRFLSAPWALVISWVLTSAIFGIAHAGNPNATLISSVNITVAGILLGLAYVVSGSLAIPIGLHITWNFFQGNVFGFPVSGTDTFPTTVMAIEQGGPEAWTGGAFGPEGGLIGLLAMLLGILCIAIWIRIRTGELTLFTAIAEPPSRPQLITNEQSAAE